MWKKNEIEKILSISRDKIARDLKLIDENQYAFCWIVDYPMFELMIKLKILIFTQSFFNASR